MAITDIRELSIRISLQDENLVEKLQGIDDMVNTIKVHFGELGNVIDDFGKKQFSVERLGGGAEEGQLFPGARRPPPPPSPEGSVTQPQAPRVEVLLELGQDVKATIPTGTEMNREQIELQERAVRVREREFELKSAEEDRERKKREIEAVLNLRKSEEEKFAAKQLVAERKVEQMEQAKQELTERQAMRQLGKLLEEHYNVGESSSSGITGLQTRAEQQMNLKRFELELEDAMFLAKEEMKRQTEGKKSYFPAGSKDLKRMIRDLQGAIEKSTTKEEAMTKIQRVRKQEEREQEILKRESEKKKKETLPELLTPGSGFRKSDLRGLTHSLSSLLGEDVGSRVEQVFNIIVRTDDPTLATKEVAGLALQDLGDKLVNAVKEALQRLQSEGMSAENMRTSLVLRDAFQKIAEMMKEG